MKKRLLIFSVLVVLINACGKDDAPPPPVEKSSAKQMTAFTFRASDNASLDADVVAGINEDSKTIAAVLPAGTDLTGLTPVIEVSSKTSFSPAGAQNFLTNVKYTVTAEDGSTVDYLASVAVTNQAPGAFDLLEVLDKAEGVDLLPTFKWEAATDPDGDSVTYDLYLDMEAQPQLVVAENLTTTSHTLETNLDFAQEYHWKVVAKDEKGAMTESAIESFTTKIMPVEFLTEFSISDEGLITISFSYVNEAMRSYYKNGMDWATTFDISSGKLAAISTSNNRNISFGYNQTGQQEQVLDQRPTGPDVWILNHDEKDRLKLVEFILEDGLGGTPFSKASFMYPDDETYNPSEIVVVDKNDTYQAKFDLKWDNQNITSIEFEGTEEDKAFSGRIEYTYDDNINPYHIILKNQFGFDDFFAFNISPEMTSMRFGPINWQSSNNITRIEQFNSPNASEPTEVWEYDYMYTEDYYPSRAVLKTTFEGETNSNELLWAY